MEKNKTVRVSILGGKETSAYHDGKNWITVEMAMFGFKNQIVSGWSDTSNGPITNQVPTREVVANALRPHLDTILWAQAALTIIVGTLI